MLQRSCSLAFQQQCRADSAMNVRQGTDVDNTSVQEWDALLQPCNSTCLMHVVQIPGGYFVKEQDGDLKFMLAFRHPAVGG